MSAFSDLMEQEQPGEQFWNDLKAHTQDLQKPLLAAQKVLQQSAHFPALDAYLDIQKQNESQSIAFAFDAGYAAGQQALVAEVLQDLLGVQELVTQHLKKIVSLHA